MNIFQNKQNQETLVQIGSFCTYVSHLRFFLHHVSWTRDLVQRSGAPMLLTRALTLPTRPASPLRVTPHSVSLPVFEHSVPLPGLSLLPL